MISPQAAVSVISPAVKARVNAGEEEPFPLLQPPVVRRVLKSQGRMPAFMRFAAWMRAKLTAITARDAQIKRYQAACSREDPWP